jgi:Glycosyltransferase family 87
VALLWLVAAACAAELAYVRYRDASAAAPGVDFRYFMAAAHNVASGRSPYANLHEYVYPPTLALILAPFVHVDLTHVWKIWVGAMVVAPLIAAAAFVVSQASRLVPWLLPFLFAFCSFTVLWIRYWPMSRDLYLGQSDTIVFPVLVISALAASRNAPSARGVWIGVAGLIKGWPASVGLSFFQKGLRRRWRSLAALVCTGVIAPVLAVAVGGTSGLVAFFKNAFDAREQRSLINDSVWAAPQLLFSRSGLAHPLVASAPLRVFVTVALASGVVVLLVVALRTVGDPAACTWNVTFCILLLLPVAHRQYAILALPLLWFWTARTLRRGRVDPWDAAVLAVLFLWWLTENVSWPYTYSPPTISALRYCAPFAADLVACTASVFGARRLGSHTVPPPDGADVADTPATPNELPQLGVQCGRLLSS